MRLSMMQQFSQNPRSSHAQQRAMWPIFAVYLTIFAVCILHSPSVWADIAPIPPPTPTTPPIDPQPASLGMSDLLGNLLRMVFMLLVVVGLIYLTLNKGLGKLMERSQLGKRMRISERLSLDTRRSLYLLQLDNKEFLVAAGEGGFTLLHTNDKDKTNNTTQATAQTTQSTTDPMNPTKSIFADVPVVSKNFYQTFLQRQQPNTHPETAEAADSTSATTQPSIPSTSSSPSITPATTISSQE